jgi:hypothetical protein
MIARGFAIGCLLLFGTTAVAQEKTPASAYQFISSTMADGSWVPSYDNCDAEGECTTEYGGTITRVGLLGGYCNLEFKMKTEFGYLSRKIDFSRSISLDDGYESGIGYYIDILGPIVDTKGRTQRSWRVYSLSIDITRRVSKALNFLIETCGAKSAF